MKRIIHKIRLQPPEFRMMVAVVAAMIITGAITALWVMSWSTGPTREETSSAPSPLSALLGSIKGTIQNPKENIQAVPTPNTVEVIDAGIE